MLNIALYIHIPFCLKRCRYCDFNTYAGLSTLIEAYVASVRAEMTLWAARYPMLQAKTLFFGGGTPSILSPTYIANMVADAREQFALPSDAEVTLEANPGTVDEAILGALRNAGVNRLSLGVQTSHAAELKLLGRSHTWTEAVQATKAARHAGFDNLNLDFIYGLPGQTLAQWQNTLTRALTLSPTHLSLYALTLEPGVPLAIAVEAGDLPKPDPDLMADMYAAASEDLHAAGFWQYEISNWALGDVPPPELWSLPPDGTSESIGAWICQHNLAYWRNTPWLGVGAGAHSWLMGHRWYNILHPRNYIQAVHRGKIPRAESEAITPDLEQAETMMMGLRLAEGVSETSFQARFNSSLALQYGDTLATLRTIGLLTQDNGRVRLSTQGRLLGNQVFGAFLPE